MVTRLIPGLSRDFLDFKLAEEAFLRDFPEYEQTKSLERLRKTEYARLDAQRQVYLDYTGGGLYASRQVTLHMKLLEGQVYGNPHSVNPSSVVSTKLCEEAREFVLRYFNASSAEYELVFTQNATGALKIVGESYPFGEGSTYLLTEDNHNSVNGIREFAHKKQAKVSYVSCRVSDLRVATGDVAEALDGSRGPDSLFAFPAQSNFSGVKHPLEWIEMAHQKGWDVLLDCSAYVPTNRLDLSQVFPDFVCVSFYKMFGYPTGIGCLIVRKRAFKKLVKPWFAGGTVWAAAAVNNPTGFILYDDIQKFEDGTIDYLSIPAVKIGLSYMEEVGIEKINTRVHLLTAWVLQQFASMPFIRVCGPADSDSRGGTIAFQVIGGDGVEIDERIIAHRAAEIGISLRTGCFCNPGAAFMAGAHSASISDKWSEMDISTVKEKVYRGEESFETFLTRTGFDSTSLFIRISFGIVSNFRDCYKLIRFLYAFQGKGSCSFEITDTTRRTVRHL